MKMLTKAMVASALFSLAGYPTVAQMHHPSCPQTGKGYGIPGAAASLAACPFSAVIEIESTQTLADGTHVQKKFKGLVYRDSAGRIRYETYAPTDSDKDFPEAPNMIQIFDPLAGFSYIFFPQTAFASRHRLNDPARSSGVNTQTQHSSAPVSTSTQSQDGGKEPVEESLGPKLMEGLLVTGRRITQTIPVGAEGNDRVLMVVREIWESYDLGITLLRKSFDPRSGDSIKRMTNLKQTEPDAALFQVPTNYTVKEE
jgi:hypothetical protein